MTRDAKEPMDSICGQDLNDLTPCWAVNCPSSTASTILKFLTREEASQICRQFQSSWRMNNQVLWSGMLREYAQKWADKHDMATLTTAMGPLMQQMSPFCLKSRKSDTQWARYIKGASAIFAWYISGGEQVIMLSPPPPIRFHPSGLTNFQTIEEPILKCSTHNFRIMLVHPAVAEASEFCYELWPNDNVSDWLARYALSAMVKHSWRQVKMSVGASDSSYAQDVTRTTIVTEFTLRKSQIQAIEEARGKQEEQRKQEGRKKSKQEEEKQEEKQKQEEKKKQEAEKQKEKQKQEEKKKKKQEEKKRKREEEKQKEKKRQEDKKKQEEKKKQGEKKKQEAEKQKEKQKQEEKKKKKQEEKKKKKQEEKTKQTEKKKCTRTLQGPKQLGMVSRKAKDNVKDIEPGQSHGLGSINEKMSSVDEETRSLCSDGLLTSSRPITNSTSLPYGSIQDAWKDLEKNDVDYTSRSNRTPWFLLTIALGIIGSLCIAAYFYVSWIR